jgi:hypothetical protein
VTTPGPTVIFEDLSAEELEAMSDEELEARDDDLQEQLGARQAEVWELLLARRSASGFVPIGRIEHLRGMRGHGPPPPRPHVQRETPPDRADETPFRLNP